MSSKNNRSGQKTSVPTPTTPTDPAKGSETQVEENTLSGTELFSGETPSEGISTPASVIKDELTESQKVTLEIFKSYITDYEKSRTSINPSVETRDKGYAVLHGAINHLVGAADPVAQKACFHYLVSRIINEDNDKVLKQAYAMPTIIGNLGDYSDIKDGNIRRFQAEFLTIIRKYALTKDKSNFSAVAPVDKVLHVILNDDSRNNIRACFGIQ